MITLRRKNFELDEPPEHQIGVFVSKPLIYLFGGMKETIKVWWHISKSENCLDWIGLFNCDDSSCYLDQKPLRRQSSPIFFVFSPKNLLNATRVYFGYIDGITGKMLARSINLEICSNANFVIHEITRGLNCLKTRIWIESDDEKVEIAEKLKKDVKLNFNWQQIRISLEAPPQASLENVDSSISRHIFTAQQLDNDCSRSIDATSTYRIELIFSVEPKSEFLNGATSSTFQSMASTSTSSSSMSTTSSLETSSLQKSAWQTCFDAKGRVFYVNHETKETSWTNPEKNLPRRRRQIQTMSTTTTTRQRLPLMIGTPKTTRKTFDGDSEENEAFITPRRTVALTKRDSSDATSLVRFFQSDDFIGLLHENETAMRLYNENTIVRHALNRIQINVDAPSKFERIPQFVEFVNSFADKSEPLPRGWDTLNNENRLIFINHSAKMTTFLDPRVRKLESKETRRGRSAPPRRLAKMDNNGNHLLINKYDEIMQIADEKLPHIADRIRKKLRLVERFGELAIASLANDLDLSLAVSMLNTTDDENNRNVAESTRNDENIRHFFATLQRLKFGRGPAKLTWKFSRDNLTSDALREILQTDLSTLKKSRLHISFDDEIALDYGGPSREFFILISRQLFHPNNGFFEYYGTDYYLQLCPREIDSSHSKQWLQLCGRILALALIHKCLIDVFFTKTFYKMLLNQKITISDFETIDTEFYNSMNWILENDVETLDIRFVFSDVSNSSQLVDVDLLPDGSNLVVNNSNKSQFVEMMCEKQAKRGIEPQLKIVTSAFHQIIDTEIVTGLTADELRMILSGSMELDLIDWRMNTIYKGGYFDGHVVIEWFWEVIEKMTNVERFNLLLFVTGSSSVPFEGFSALRGNNGSNKFCIEKWGEEVSLPRAHTCFNRLQLPSYPTKQIMRAKIAKAIENGMNYSIE